MLDGEEVKEISRCITWKKNYIVNSRGWPGEGDLIYGCGHRWRVWWTMLGVASLRCEQKYRLRT